MPPAVLAQANGDFLAAKADTTEVLASIARHWARDQYLFCPHSACGVVAAHKLNLADGSMVCLATAHAGKFYDNVQKAVAPLPPVPDLLRAVQTLPMRMADLPCNLEACQAFVFEKCGLAAPKAANEGGSFSPVVFAPLLAALALMFYSSLAAH